MNNWPRGEQMNREPMKTRKSTPEERIAAGANEFAFRLSAALADKAGDENMVCSPFSVWLPLAALINAAGEKERPKLLSALNAVGISEVDINETVKGMLYDLTGQREKEYNEKAGLPYHETLRIANIILARNDVTLKTGFGEILSDSFNGHARSIDFSSSEAIDAINNIVSEITEGHISEIVQGFDPTTVAALACAMYFSDRWGWEFEVDRKNLFFSPDGETEAVFIKRSGDEQTYFEDEKVQAISLDFLSGRQWGRFSLSWETMGTVLFVLQWQYL